MNIAEARQIPLDLDALTDWMTIRGLSDGPIEDLEILSGGTQNILVRFSATGRKLVLRRPPLHLRADSNDAMRREVRVLGGLADSEVPHPRLVAACEDENVLGAVFYIMTEVDGVNISTDLQDAHRDASAQYRMGLAMVDALAALGRVDYRAAGLGDFGKPNGYLERQVARWHKQIAGYSQLEGWPGASSLPHLDRIQSWLESNRPPPSRPGILHGDFHIANVMFDRAAPQVAAIIDWELATIGDPLIDLGWMLATWPDEDSEPMSPIFSVRPWLGFPEPRELVERYREGSTRDVSAINWYAALACYKLGAILEGTYARACAGMADKALGDRMHAATLALFERAARLTSQ